MLTFVPSGTLLEATQRPFLLGSPCSLSSHIEPCWRLPSVLSCWAAHAHCRPMSNPAPMAAVSDGHVAKTRRQLTLPFGSSSTTCVPLRRRCRRSALLSDARSSPSLSRRPFVTHSSSLFLPARPSSPSRLARQPPPPGGEGGSSPLWLCVSSVPGGRQSARVFAIGVILDPLLVASFYHFWQQALGERAKRVVQKWSNVAPKVGPGRPGRPGLFLLEVSL